MSSSSNISLISLVQLSLLKGDATKADVEQLCQEAKRFSARSICVQSSRIVQASFYIEETNIKLGCMIGFPFGTADSDVKRYEVETSIDLGAQEIEVAANLGRLKEKDDTYLLREIRDVVDAAEDRPVTLVVETSLLAPEEKALACAIAVEGGAKFIKTSSGLQSATAEDVKFLRGGAGEKFGIVAAGVFRDRAAVETLLAAGANRISVPAGTQLLSQLA